MKTSLRLKNLSIKTLKFTRMIFHTWELSLLFFKFVFSWFVTSFTCCCSSLTAKTYRPTRSGRGTMDGLWKKSDWLLLKQIKTKKTWCFYGLNFASQCLGHSVHYVESCYASINLKCFCNRPISSKEARVGSAFSRGEISGQFSLDQLWWVYSSSNTAKTQLKHKCIF